MFDNIATCDPYKLGGAIIGMAYQLVGMNTQDNNALIKLLEINDQLDSISAEKRGPVVHGMALAVGLVTLGQGNDEINEMLAKSLSDDVDANFGVLIGLGLSNFGNAKFFQSNLCRDHVLGKLASEKEKERQAASLCLSLLCFKNEKHAEPIIQYLVNFSVENPSQFGDSVEYFSTFAIGMAFFQTENVSECQRLLLLANKFARSQGARQAAQALGFILKPTQQAF